MRGQGDLPEPDVVTPGAADPVTGAGRAVRALTRDASEVAGVGIIRETLCAVRETLGLDLAFVSRLDDDEMVYELIAGDPSTFGAQEGMRVPLGQTYCSIILTGEVPEMMGDVRDYPDAAAMAVTEAAGIGAYCSVPLRHSDGELYGTLCATSHQPARFDDRDLRVLRLLGRLIVDQIEQDTVTHERAALVTAVEHSANAIMHIGLDGAVLSWNAAAERLFGFPRAEALGRPILDLVVGESERQEAQGWLKRAMSGEQISYEVLRHAKDGSERWVAATLAPVLGTDGTVLSISAVAQDISRQRRRQFHRQIERDVIATLGAAKDVRGAVSESFAVICRGHKLALAVLWEMDETGRSLQLTHHHASDESRDMAAVVQQLEAHPRAHGEGLAGRVWSTREADWCPDLRLAEPVDAVLADSGLESSIIVPVLAGDELVAVAQFYAPEHRIRNDAQLVLARDLLSRMAVAVQRLRAQTDVRDSRDRLLSEVRARTGELEAALAELEAAQTETVRRLSAAIEFRDEDTGEHIARVSGLARDLAVLAGLGEDLCDLISRAAPLHDLGKVAIPDAVLLKPDALKPLERAIIETHAEIGHQLLDGSRSPLLQKAALIALTHHERWDGRGYPQGIGAEEIPIEGRIVAIADVFDALISDRVYRPAMLRADALAIIAQGRGTQLDPRLVDLFLGSELGRPGTSPAP